VEISTTRGKKRGASCGPLHTRAERVVLEFQPLARRVTALVPSPVSESVLLTALWSGRERFAFGNGPLHPVSFAALGTNDFVLPRILGYVARLQEWLFLQAFHLLSGENLARVYTPKKEERGTKPLFLLSGVHYTGIGI
jgi:hypothetical protein